MNQKIYTTAVIRTLQAGTPAEQSLSGLREVLTRHGHMSLYSTILKNVLRTLLKSEKDTSARITLARTDDAQVYAADIKAFLADARATSHEIIIDETIIGGFTARTTAMQRNQSYKESLASIYRAVTAE